MPDELKDLTWIEELLITRAHVVGRVVWLQACNQASYFGIKGHIILLTQDSMLLLNVLPMMTVSLPDWKVARTQEVQQDESYLSI